MNTCQRSLEIAKDALSKIALAAKEEQLSNYIGRDYIWAIATRANLLIQEQEKLEETENEIQRTHCRLTAS